VVVLNLINETLIGITIVLIYLRGKRAYQLVDNALQTFSTALQLLQITTIQTMERFIDLSTERIVRCLSTVRRLST